MCKVYCGFVTFLIILFGTAIYAQSLPVGTAVLEDYYRRNQLLGLEDSSVSFMIRPLSMSEESSTEMHGFGLDTLNRSNTGFKKFNKGLISFFPVNWQQQYNSDHPYGWNDGIMIPAKGYQTVLSTGVYARYGPLSIQLKPEFVFAANNEFEGFSTEHYDEIWAAYYSIHLNLTDLPERFGKSVYHKFSWGQSNIGLTFNPVSISLSNENLWWGPGIRSSLLMSNTAAGFKHITLNTIRPVKTWIGSFEAQMIAGRLENSGYPPPEPYRVFQGRTLYLPKEDQWRYLSGMTFTYQPKWIPGLFFGFARVFQMYHKDLDGHLDNFIPLFQPFAKNRTREDAIARDQLASVFVRWVWEDSKAEIYAEYGRNDHSANLRDFLLEPDHSAAYLLGFRKILPLNKKKGEYIQASVELTQLAQSAVRLVRNAGPWYVHNLVRQGYTNKGEVLGAGIGPGSNLQSLDVSWFKGLKSIGIQLERYVHNNDFYYSVYEHIHDPRRHWVDLSVAGKAEWNYKNLLLNAKLSAIRSLNYEYYLLDNPPEYFAPGRDVFNFHAQLGIAYRF